jgi:hypothetical protein
MKHWFGEQNVGGSMVLAEVTDWDSCARAPHIGYENVRFLWVTDITGLRLLSGMLEYGGETCAYLLVGEREEGTRLDRRFVVVRLSPTQTAEEMRWHDGVKQKVGEGRDWQWWDEVYRQRLKPDYSQCEVVGWFEC